MMLSGAALEALIKGIMVAENPEVVQPDPKKPLKMFKWKGSGHELRELLAELGFEIGDDEDDLLRRLEVFVRWGGRYPAPMQALEMRHGPTIPPPASFSTEDLPAVTELFRRLRERLEAAALLRHQLNEESDGLRRKAKRSELLAELRSFNNKDQDGITLFEDIDGIDEPGAAVSCASCGAQFTLNARYPAATCRCNNLYHCEPFFDASLGRVIPKVEGYPS